MAKVVLGTAAAAAAGVAAYIYYFGRPKKEASWHATLPVFTLRNALGMEVQVSAFGAAILKVMVPDRRGKKADVVLGYDAVDSYDVSRAQGPCAWL